ncbi:hypothetical protein LSAT2_008756, partial [Lamellibrachia satsuma]
LRAVAPPSLAWISLDYPGSDLWRHRLSHISPGINVFGSYSVQTRIAQGKNEFKCTLVLEC